MTLAATKLDLFDDRAEIELAEHAAVIKTLGKRVVTDVIEIGARLAKCKEIAGHGNWLPWLAGEFGWQDKTAERFMSVHALAGKFDNLSNLELPVSGLYLLAAPSTPAAARDAIIERAANGEHLSLDDVKRTVEQARDAEAADHERQLTSLREELARREKEIRDEYADKFVLDEKQLSRLVAKQLKPLEKLLATAQRKLDSAEKRLAKKDAKGKPKSKPMPMPKINATISLRSTSITSGVNCLAAALLISQAEMIDVETKSAQVTGEHISDRIGKTLAEARHVIEWLTTFVKLAEEACKK